MKRIVFVTDNQDNFESAKRFLNKDKIVIVKSNHHQNDNQEDNVQDFITKKVKEAYAKVQEPCFVIEHNFMIDALNGFPGMQTKYVLDTIGVDGILKIMADQPQRSCTYRHCIAYYDGHEVLYFYSDEQGMLASKKAGTTNGNDLYQIFISNKFQDALDHPEEAQAYLPDCIEQFAKYLNAHLFSLIDDPYQNLEE